MSESGKGQGQNDLTRQCVNKRLMADKSDVGVLIPLKLIRLNNSNAFASSLIEVELVAELLKHQ